METLGSGRNGYYASIARTIKVEKTTGRDYQPRITAALDLDIIRVQADSPGQARQLIVETYPDLHGSTIAILPESQFRKRPSSEPKDITA